MRVVVLAASSLLIAACAMRAAPPAMALAEAACLPEAPPPAIWTMPLTLPVAGTVRFVPRSTAAERYNDLSAAVPHTPLGDAVVAAARDAALRAGLPPPEPDA